MNPRTRTHRAAAAFSLIEILVSVLILGLGLLGLGALFPVVLREQRIGTDNILGVVVTNNVKAALPHMDLNPLLQGWNVGDQRDVWSNWRWHTGNGVAELDDEDYELGEWWVARVDNNGDATFGDDASSNRQVPVPLRSRLYPFAGAGSSRPQYVWDIAVHRVPDFVPGNSSQFDPLHAVIFVRRVDPRIRFNEAPNVTLLRTFVDRSLPANQWRLPVGREAGNSILPTLDGTDGAGGVAYSEPVVATRGVDFDFDTSIPAALGPGRYISRLNVGSPDGIAALMAQPNQRLVDNLGNIYTVEVIENDPPPAAVGRKRVRINPPIPESLRTNDANRPRIVQFVFTPQVPAGVAVVEVIR